MTRYFTVSHSLPVLLFAASALAALAIAAPVTRASAAPADGPLFIIVQGSPGEESYAEDFTRQAAVWQKTATNHQARIRLIGQDPSAAEDDRTKLQATLADEPKETTAPLWIILIGHGTFDRQVARFNLRGEDVSAEELAGWLEPFRRPIAVINTSSASAPFLAALSGEDRVIITATRSGNEQNATRFGTSLATTLVDPATDLDQDGQVSLLEAFLSAASRVAEFYRTEGRLATEHALIDDNGDGLGTPASWFRGLRATKKARNAAALDGIRAHQWLLTPDPADTARPPEWRARRDTLEAAVIAIRDQKDSLPHEEYYRQLEAALLELARHYDSLKDGDS